jgi:hypothetical protein
MRNSSTTGRLTKFATALAVVALVAGCSSTRDWISDKLPTRQGSNEPVILGAPDAETYLEELNSLAGGDPATQAEIYADAESGHMLTPGPSTDLRFALVLATPGHSESDPERAQSMLRELLIQTPLLTPAEIALATIHLNAVEEIIVAESEARRVRSQTSRQARTQQEAISERLANVEAENRRLRRELEEAEVKLEAITTIERDIREQD